MTESYVVLHGSGWTLLDAVIFIESEAKTYIAKGFQPHGGVQLQVIPDPDRQAMHYYLAQAFVKERVEMVLP